MKLLMLAWTTFNIPVVASPCYGKFADCKNYIHRFVICNFYEVCVVLPILNVKGVVVVVGAGGGGG